MYRCSRCGQTFDSPDTVVDFFSEAWGRQVKHYTSVCPNCGSDDFDEMDKCEICGEWISPGEDVCDNCAELIKDISEDIRGRVRYVSLRYKLKYDEFIEHLIKELNK